MAHIEGSGSVGSSLALQKRVERATDLANRRWGSVQEPRCTVLIARSWVPSCASRGFDKAALLLKPHTWSSSLMWCTKAKEEEEHRAASLSKALHRARQHEHVNEDSMAVIRQQCWYVSEVHFAMANHKQDRKSVQTCVGTQTWLTMY